MDRGRWTPATPLTLMGGGAVAFCCSVVNRDAFVVLEQVALTGTHSLFTFYRTHALSSGLTSGDHGRVRVHPRQQR